MRWNKLFSQRIFFQDEALSKLKQEYTLVDMHSHTKYSHDCQTPVKTMIKTAQKLGIGFAVTDHVMAEGALEAAKQKKVLVIPGIEIASVENKEILLYFYTASQLKDFYEKYVKSTRKVQKPKSSLRSSIMSVKSSLTMTEIFERSEEYSCLRCIPHPYTYPPRSSHRFFQQRPEILKKMDAIEVVNSTNRPFMNKRATAWAIKNKKAFTAGSDAHNYKDLGKSVVACQENTVEGFLDSIKRKENIILGAEHKARATLKNMLEMNQYKRKKKWYSES